WYTIDAKLVQNFRTIVKKKWDLDIYKNEGLWFSDLDFVLANEIEVSYFLQEKGDIVLIGPGCLHWVRAQGVAVNTAWNFATRTKEQVIQSKHFLQIKLIEY